jgi:hypothetical protein
MISFIKYGSTSSHLHCSESPISVSDLFIPRIGPPIWLQQNRRTWPILGIEAAHRKLLDFSVTCAWF